jgi:hypothetical protein
MLSLGELAMPKKIYLRVLILALISLMMVPTYVFLVSSSEGYIRVNGKSASIPGQQVQAGGNVNLYFGEVTWSGSEFYLLMSLDSYQQVSVPDIIYTPRFAISELTNSTTTKTYTSGIGAWVIGNNWVNGTIAQNVPVGNYTIKAFDEVSGTVAVTDVFIMVYSVIYSSNLQISPSSGPGGVSAQFTGSGFPPSSGVTVSYFDPAFGSWNALAAVTANASGSITFTSEIPDLRKSLGIGDYPEAYTRISYRAEIHGVVYCYVDYNQYSRGLKRVGNQTANGLYGNGTNLASTVNVVTGDNIALSGKWFHPRDVIYIKWDGVSVVGTLAGNQGNAETIGTSIANSVGSFDASVPIPTANAGEHYLSVEDSQAKIIVKIYVSMASLYLSPVSGPGGVSVQFTGSRYPPSAPVTISYRDPTFGTWNVFGNTTSDASGRIQFSAEMPDLRRSLTAYDSYESSYAVSFRTEQGSTIYCYADYNEYARGLKRVGNQTAYGLYGNGTNLASTVMVAPGDAITISGKWFHAEDVVYIRWDGQAVVGTVTGNEWRNAAIIGSSIANASGYFQATVPIPTANAGEHYLSVEDSQAKIIVKVVVVLTSGQNPPFTKAPSTIDLSCTSTTTYIGYKVEINGTLSCNRTTISDAPVLLSYSVSGGTSWEDLTLVYTGSDGGFFAVWMPSVSGNYLIKAKWDGNFAINGTSKIVSLASAPYSDQNVFSVTSNSTVSALSFNSATNELSFVVNGTSGTTGFVDVGVAKSLIADIANLRVYLDGSSMNYTVTSTSDTWFLHFNYTHSTHNVMIDLGETVSPSPNPTATPAPTAAPTSAPTSPPSSSPTNTPRPSPANTPTPTATPSPSPEPSSTPAIPEFPIAAPLLVMIATSAVAFILAKKRRAHA